MCRTSFRRLTSAIVATAASTMLLLAAPAGAATAGPHGPAVPRGLPAAIEPMAYYVGQSACDPRTRPGTRKLADLLAATYRSNGATAYNTTYQCGTDGSQSEHYDGRAIDWMVDVHDKGQHAAARSFLSWLLATDAAGNRYAMARRLGVMYVIYDNRMWGSWDGQWENYNGCAKLKSRADDNACHRTHMHISLGWDGAFGRTSFWTRRVPAQTDFGPCRPSDLNWAPRYSKPDYAGCTGYRTVRAAKGSSAVKRTLVQYSGAAIRPGSSGPIVTAVQQALHVSATGSYSAATRSAVRALQARAHISTSGVMTAATWRALLARTK